MMKKIIAFLLLLLVLSGCAKGTNETDDETAGDENNETVEETVEREDHKALVIYFSRTGEQYRVGVIEKGNTDIVAEIIKEETDADMFEIKPAKDNYPATYEELTDYAKKEQNDNARPAYEGQLPDLNEYDVIFIGAPVWWGDWPMIMYTVFENNDFSNKTLIPFNTHEGSGLSGFDRKLASACPDSDVLEGLAITGSQAQNDYDKCKEDVINWLNDLNY